ncbi:MAG: protoporphyrinogen oxidase HemJ [Alcanivoracaceae bacterium]|nr:protoporphyrinogen oxidase HemJ [Alcanivoracaceae bacterium]
MLWLKALHIISVICWFAALFYLPRLFVYHAQADDTISKERFKIMERKLYRGIMTPAMLASLVFGGWMLIENWSIYKTQGWMHAKLTLVFLLIGYHHMCLAFMKKFAADANTKSHVFYRWFNEVPVIFLIAIVILAVVKPF